MRRARTAVVIVAALFLVAGVMVAIKLADSSAGSENSKLMPDGSVMHLSQVTYGKQHSFTCAPGWRKLLRPFVASTLGQQFGLAGRFGITTLSHTTTNDTLVVWTYHQNQGCDTAPRGNGYVPTRVVFCDEDGNELEPPPGSGERAQLGSGTVVGSIMPLLPENGRTITVRLMPRDYKKNSYHPVEFTFPNPATNGPSPWQPNSYPITEKADDLDVTLLDLRPAKEAPKSNFGGATWMQASFRITAGGKSLPAWQVIGVRVFDSMGNAYAPGMTRASKEADEKQFFFRGLLSSTTPRKIRFEISREKDFPPEELWVLRDLPVTQPAINSLARQKKEFDGLTVEFLGFQQGGFAFRFPAEQQGRRMETLSVIDDQGRMLESTGGMSDNWTRYYTYEIPPDARTATLTVAVHRTRFVEFLARPNP